jgi:molecular chaperone DnaK
LEKVLALRSAVDVSDEAVEKMLEDSLEHAFEDVSDRIFVEAKLKSDELLPAVEKALIEVGADLDAGERALIAKCVADVESAMATGGGANLKRANGELDVATQRLATLLIERAMSA